MRDKRYGIISLAMKAGAVASGETSAEEAVRGGKAHLVVLAEDARGTVPALIHAEYAGHVLCDYASAGNPPDRDHALTVWFRREK